MTRRGFLLALAGAGCAQLTISAQAGFDEKTLASYRLTEPVFKRFAHATRIMGKTLRSDARYRTDPLITEDIALAADVAIASERLRQRLDGDAPLTAALFAADIGSHEYVTFAIALFAARLAHGFVRSGAMRRVPSDVHADNVAFVAAHEAEVEALMKLLGLP